MLVSDVFGSDPSADAITMFDQFAFVLCFIGLGFILGNRCAGLELASSQRFC